MQTQRVNQSHWLSSSPIPLPLAGGLICVIAIYAYGVGLLMADASVFRIWIHEDGLVEWLSFGVLAIACGYTAFLSAVYYHNTSNRAACRTWTFLALLFLFGALEEVSYGQRIFGIETPDFLLPDGSQGRDSFYNAQGETNIHNLVIYGVKLNKLVFGKLLAIFVILYFLVIPVVYRYNRRFQIFSDVCGLPIIQNYQLVVYLVLVVLSAPLHSLDAKINELLELAGCFAFLSMTVHPFNAAALPTVKNIYKRVSTSTVIN